MISTRQFRMKKPLSSQAANRKPMKTIPTPISRATPHLTNIFVSIPTLYQEIPSGAGALREIHERSERLRVKARSTHQRAIQFFLRHQPLNIVGLDAAAIENPEGGGVADGELLPRASPEKPMSFGGNFRCRGAARADGPDRLESHRNTGELLRGQRAGAAAELPAENLFGKAGVTVFLRFSEADDGSEAARQRHQGLLDNVAKKTLMALAIGPPSTFFRGPRVFFVFRCGRWGEGGRP